jgi:uncharacterized protein (DUF983 family)
VPRDDQDYPIIPHEAVAAVDCGGCLYVRERGDEAEIVCNECGAAVCTVRADEAAAVMNALITEIAATAFSTARCPHCGALNTFPGFTFMEAFVCSECGEGVTVDKPVQ